MSTKTTDKDLIEHFEQLVLQTDFEGEAPVKATDEQREESIIAANRPEDDRASADKVLAAMLGRGGKMPRIDHERMDVARHMSDLYPALPEDMLFRLIRRRHVASAIRLDEAYTADHGTNDPRDSFRRLSEHDKAAVTQIALFATLVERAFQEYHGRAPETEGWLYHTRQCLLGVDRMRRTLNHIAAAGGS